MAKFELDSKGQPVSNPKVSEARGFALDIEGAPPVYPGHGGDNGSHVSNYPTGNAFVAAEPPRGFNKPAVASELTESSGGMKMRNDLSGGEKSNPRVTPGLEEGGASHQVFSTLSTDGTGRGVSEDKTEVELFGGNEGQRDMNPPSPRRVGGGALKGYS